MYGLQSGAKRGQIARNNRTDAADISAGQAIDLAQGRRSLRAIQIEHCLASTTDDMNVRRPMIGEIDDDPQASDTQDSRHCL
jgi:hypothetical protein